MKAASWLLGASVCFMLAGNSVVSAKEEAIFSVDSSKVEEDGSVYVQAKVSEKEITSGKVIFSYNAEELELEDVKSEMIWDVENLNKDKKTDNKRAVSFAWANKAPSNQKGNLISLKFKKKEVSKDAYIYTKVEELYQHNENKKLDKEIKTMISSNKTDTSIPANPKQPTKKQQNTKQQLPVKKEITSTSKKGVMTGVAMPVVKFIALAGTGAVLSFYFLSLKKKHKDKS